jgi:alkaline phosphatase D
MRSIVIATLFLITAPAVRAQVEFVWSGAVTDCSARIKAKVLPDGAIVRVGYTTQPDFSTILYSIPDTASAAANNRVVDLYADSLNPATTYYYAIEIDGVLDTEKRGRLRTMLPYGAGIFTIALGSCANTASNHAVFQTIAAHDPLLFLHMGDFHYQNIGVNDRNVFRAAYESVLSSPNQSVLYRSTAMDYIWDDHDYGPNNSDSTAPGREASRLTYQEYVPHHPLAAGNGDVPIYHKFTIGRVAFIVTDSRSARSPASAIDDASKTMLGVTQKAWFKQTLIDLQADYPLKVWVNTLPWIGTTGDDGWHLYTNERREIADFIKANAISGLCMVSGDAHMLAIDDGTNSDYATGGGASFPVFHAAALDRTGSVKGGPYSHGAYPGGGQFGLMSVFDSGGSTITVQWSGRTSTNVQRVAHSFVAPAAALPCACSSHGDVSGNDGIINVLDVVAIVDHVFRNGPMPTRDLVCPHLHRGDLNCDAQSDVLDVVHMVGGAFRSGSVTCQPCDCPPFPAQCP